MTQSRFLRRQEGASAVEYALILGILAVIFIAGFLLLGGNLESVFSFISGELGSVGTGGSGSGTGTP